MVLLLRAQIDYKISIIKLIISGESTLKTCAKMWSLRWLSWSVTISLWISLTEATWCVQTATNCCTCRSCACLKVCTSRASQSRKLDNSFIPKATDGTCPTADGICPGFRTFRGIPTYRCADNGSNFCGLGLGYGPSDRCDLSFPCIDPDSGKTCCDANYFCQAPINGDCDLYQLKYCNKPGPFVSIGSTTDATGSQDPNKTCGNGKRNSGRCAGSVHCCSKEGNCDYGDAYCTVGSGSYYVVKDGAWVNESNDLGIGGTVTYCGNGTIGNGLCPAQTLNGVTYSNGDLCCSPSGFCGNQGVNGVDTFCVGDGAVSGPTYTCNCANGIGATGTSSTCNTCISCNSGYALSTNSHCIPGTSSCSSGNFITQITIRSGYWMDGITSIKCSDGATITINAGGLGGGPHTVTSGDGSINSPGYCSQKSGLYGVDISQLSFKECTTASVDGPFGIGTPYPINTKTCGSGMKAVGVKFDAGIYLTSFDFICAKTSVTHQCLICHLFA